MNVFISRTRTCMIFKTWIEPFNREHQLDVDIASHALKRILKIKTKNLQKMITYLQYFSKYVYFDMQYKLMEICTKICTQIRSTIVYNHRQILIIVSQLFKAYDEFLLLKPFIEKIHICKTNSPVLSEYALIDKRIKALLMKIETDVDYCGMFVWECLCQLMNHTKNDKQNKLVCSTLSLDKIQNSFESDDPISSILEKIAIASMYVFDTTELFDIKNNDMLSNDNKKYQFVLCFYELFDIHI